MTIVDLAFPFTGRWLTQNSPANRIPSHGTTRFATSYAIDFVPVDHNDATAPLTVRSLLRPESPQRFVGFGRPVLAPAKATVVAVHGAEPDHAAYRGFPSVWYALTQPGRISTGWTALAGNYVMLQSPTAIIALCHLQHGSITVQLGQRVAPGDIVGRCGNSGNSTEPHLHLQAIDNMEIAKAHAVPITFEGALPRNGQIVDIHAEN